jgi:hypothetical protein
MQLRRSQRTSKRGIGIAVDQHPVRLLLLDQCFDTLEHATGHGAMAQAVNTEVVVRARDVKLFEENIGHPLVEMLAGVNDDFVDIVARADDAADSMN